MYACVVVCPWLYKILYVYVNENGQFSNYECESHVCNRGTQQEPSEELSVTGLVVSLGVLSSTEVEILKEWTQSNLHHTVPQVERDHCILQEQEDAYTSTQSHS